MGGIKWNPFKDIEKVVRGTVGSAVNGFIDSATGGLGSWGTERITGKSPSELLGLSGGDVSGLDSISKSAQKAMAPVQNPFQIELETSARDLGSQGRALTGLVTPELHSAITNRISSLKNTDDIDRLAQMIVGRGVTSNEAAYQRAKANTEASFARRGIGGGVAAGARALLEGKKLAGQNDALQSAERFKITETQRRGDALTRMLVDLMDRGQADTLRSDALLWDMGNTEAKRLAAGQKSWTDFLREAGVVAGQVNASKDPYAAGAAPVAKRPSNAERYVAGSDYIFEPTLTDLDRPLTTVAPVRRPITNSSLAGTLDEEESMFL